MAEPRIIVGFHSTGTSPTNFAIDLAKAMRYSGTLVPQALHEQSCYVDTARNRIVTKFLGMPPQEATHLLMIDVDLAFPPDAFLKTFHIMESCSADVLYMNYSLGNSGNSIFGPPENSANEAAVLVNLQPNTIYSDIGTGGTGWVMMRRALLERMKAECPGPWHWFARDLTHTKDDFRGEDVSFGLRLWYMNPRPKVMASTHLLLRHLKTQPFIPSFMSPVAAAEKIPALAMPNPYEADTQNFHVTGNNVVHKKPLTPELRAKLEAEGKLPKEAAHGSVGSGNEQVEKGDATLGVGQGPGGEVPEASGGDHAQREAEGPRGEEGVPKPAEAAAPPSDGPPKEVGPDGAE